MKDYKAPRPERGYKATKLHECGHVTVTMRDKSRSFDKCTTLTSRKIKLKDGRSIYICPAHEKDPQYT